MNIYLEKVDVSKKDILYKLLQYSLFEESKNDLNEMNDEGVFAYPYFESYFSDDSRDAYFIKEKETNKLLGFAMVNDYLQIYDNGHSISEFLVIPKYRRNHIGSSVASLIFDIYRGNWEVKPADNSESAYLFWKNTIDRYTHNNYQYKKGILFFNNEKGD